MNDKNSKLTIKELRGHLDNCSKTEIIELLVQSFKISKEVQSFISVQLKGEDALKEVMENYKKKIKAEFFPVRGNEKLRVSVVKKAMSDLKKVTKESQHIFELMVLLT